MRGYTVTLFSGAPLRSDIEVWAQAILMVPEINLTPQLEARVKGRFAPLYGADAVDHPQRIYPIGRLDKDSEGLILLTNHSEMIDKIGNSKYEHEKEYIVTLNLPVRKQFLDEISQGIEIHGEQTKPCEVAMEPGTKRVFRITLTQGLNRQIRRMCNEFDYQVIKLQRVRVMNIKLAKLKVGEWRDLTELELKELMSQVTI